MNGCGAFFFKRLFEKCLQVGKKTNQAKPDTGLLESTVVERT
jgi:hypothetical protein